MGTPITNETRQMVALNLTNWLMNCLLAANIDTSKDAGMERMMKLLKEATKCLDIGLTQVFGESKIKVFPFDKSKPVR